MPESPSVHLRSPRFVVQPGEDDELVNEGTYGKVLALYLQEALAGRGWEVPFICCEDWGWWVEIGGQPYTLGLCVYGSPDLAETNELAVKCSLDPGRRWSWRRFRFVDTGPRVERLNADVLALFADDPAIEILTDPG
jgi:hypothetical protein